MRLCKNLKGLFTAAALALAALTFAGCQDTPGNGNGNAAVNVNVGATANSNVAGNTNAGSASVGGDSAGSPDFAASEPASYNAKMVVLFAAQGQPEREIPLTIEVAKMNDNKRIAINTPLPGAGNVIVLDKDGKRYALLSGQNQYIDLAEVAGVNFESMPSPAGLINKIKSQPGVTLVGEETWKGRQVIKYRAAGRAQTQTQAGEAAVETFIYVDKATGLPARIENYADLSGTAPGGLKNGKIILEMRDINTSPGASLFEIPAGYRKLTAEEARQKATELAQTAAMIIQIINQQTGGATPAR